MRARIAGEPPARRPGFQQHFCSRSFSVRTWIVPLRPSCSMACRELPMSHQHLLQLPGIAVHFGQRGVQLDLDANFFHGDSTAGVHRPKHDSFSDTVRLSAECPWIQKQLTQDGLARSASCKILLRFIHPPEPAGRESSRCA